MRATRENTNNFRGYKNEQGRIKEIPDKKNYFTTNEILTVAIVEVYNMRNGSKNDLCKTK